MLTFLVLKIFTFYKNDVLLFMSNSRPKGFIVIKLGMLTANALRQLYVTHGVVKAYIYCLFESFE